MNNFSELDQSLKNLSEEQQLLWFLIPPIKQQINYYFWNKPEFDDQMELANFRKGKIDFINWVAHNVDKSRISFAKIIPEGLDEAEYKIPNREINQIIIHHTDHSIEDSGIKIDDQKSYLRHLSTLQMLNLFTRYHGNEGNIEYGKPIYSGRTMPSLKSISKTQNHKFFLNTNFPNFICYHYIIFPDGVVVQTNNHDQRTWHASGANIDSLSICLIGNFDSKIPTDQALESAKNLISKLKQEYKINKPISGHREMKGHSKNHCPGLTFPDWKALIDRQLKTSRL